MNAEIFEKKEYADSVARVDFVRVCTLNVGDVYLYQGLWRVVRKRDKKGIYSKYKETGNQITEPFGLNNQMFVQVAKLTAADGFGGVWSKRCPMCGRNGMQVMRPGKVQCRYCG